MRECIYKSIYLFFVLEVYFYILGMYLYIRVDIKHLPQGPSVPIDKHGT